MDARFIKTMLMIFGMAFLFNISPVLCVTAVVFSPIISKMFRVWPQ